jgi:hypothetical protein
MDFLTSINSSGDLLGNSFCSLAEKLLGFLKYLYFLLNYNYYCKFYTKENYSSSNSYYLYIVSEYVLK